MKIKCICNTTNKLEDKWKKALNGYDFNSFDLAIGESFTVYGLTLRDGEIWYYICTKNNNDYPIWKPYYFFEIQNPSLSRFWIISCNQAANYIRPFPIITFSTWAHNHPDFYDRLTDGFETETKIFKKYKELMDLEFPDLTISQIAQLGDENWLICPDCIEGWDNASSIDALVRCPKCLKIFNNPRY